MAAMIHSTGVDRGASFILRLFIERLLIELSEGKATCHLSRPPTSWPGAAT
jgi:hypothetical protein